jgi:hypothetical protein
MSSSIYVYVIQRGNNIIAGFGVKYQMQDYHAKQLNNEEHLKFYRIGHGDQVVDITNEFYK